MKEEIEEIIELTDKDGNKSKYEILDVINRDDEDFAVLLPEGSEDEVVIFRVDPLEEDEVEYVEVTDDELADSIFEEFVKRIDSQE